MDYALRRLAPAPPSREELLALRGTGWSGDLDEIRAGWAPRTKMTDFVDDERPLRSSPPPPAL